MTVRWYFTISFSYVFITTITLCVIGLCLWLFSIFALSSFSLLLSGLWKDDEICILSCSLHFTSVCCGWFNLWWKEWSVVIKFGL